MKELEIVVSTQPLEELALEDKKTIETAICAPADRGRFEIFIRETNDNQFEVVAKSRKITTYRDFSESLIQKLFSFSTFEPEKRNIALMIAPERDPNLAEKKFNAIKKRLEDFCYCERAKGEDGLFYTRIEKDNNFELYQNFSFIIDLLYESFEDLVYNRRHNKLKIAYSPNFPNGEALYDYLKKWFNDYYPSWKLDISKTIEGDFITIETDENYPHMRHETFVQNVIYAMMDIFNPFNLRSHYLSVEEAAEKLNITRRSVVNRIRSGKIVAQRLGNGKTSGWIIPRYEIRRLTMPEAKTNQ